MNWIEILGFAAGTLTTLAFLPQFVKLVKSKSARDISIPTYFALCLGTVLWLIYGLIRADAPLIAANGIALLIITASLYLIIKYNK